MSAGALADALGVAVTDVFAAVMKTKRPAARSPSRPPDEDASVSIVASCLHATHRIDANRAQE